MNACSISNTYFTSSPQAYYYKDIPEGDRSIEEKVQKRENKESKRIEEIKTSNEKNMERAKKNYESGAVFQADDEKLSPYFFHYSFLFLLFV